VSTTRGSTTSSCSNSSGSRSARSTRTRWRHRSAPTPRRLTTTRGEDGGDDVQEAVGEPIDGPTRDELRDELRELDLPVSGTKDELAERLDEAKQDED
jgi:hypothetical protein